MVSKKLDISITEDLTVGVQNIISAEEHSKQSFFSSTDEKFLKANTELRKIRTRWMQIIFGELEGNSKQFNKDSGDLLGMYYWLIENRGKSKGKDQVWCLSKHLLSASMRAMECADKYSELEESKRIKMKEGEIDAEGDSYWDQAKKGFKILTRK